MKNNKTIILTTLIILLAIGLFFGITYAYFDLTIKAEDSSTMVIGGAEVSASFVSTSTITIEDALPSDDPIGYKDFSITVKNTSNNSYKLYLKAIINSNTFTDTENDGVLYYDIYSGTNHDTLVQEKTMFPTITSGKSLLKELTIPAKTNTTTQYRLNLYFPDSDKIQNKNGRLSLNASITIENSKEEEVASFADDSWETIANNVANGNASIYNIGDEKEIKIDNTSYTVRIANNSTPDECSSDDFSETACGFVIEFVDIIEERKMSSTGDYTGGWESSELRDYLNSDFIKTLPTDLQNLIIETKVISGYSAIDSNAENFETYDQIYLLGVHEIYDMQTDFYLDTSYNNTRQLDYYVNNNVTVSANKNFAIKQSNNENTDWWLRSVYGPIANVFKINSNGALETSGAVTETLGVAPAFRIG